MQGYTDITILLDRSGSMASIKTAMESAFGEFLQQHRSVPSTRLSLIQFDSENPQEAVYIGIPIADAPNLDLTPRGSTPLLDALCRAIDNTGTRLSAMLESERPARVLMVIVTDGQENASREFKREHVKDRITKQSAIYQWQFVYLGANQDAFEEAASFGIARGQTLNYAASASGSNHAMRAMSANTMKYASGAASAIDCFTDDQRHDAMDKSKKKANPQTA